jgi:hypothetical protein
MLRLSEYQFSPFEVGQVKAHLHHGLGAAEMSGILMKGDGKTNFSTTAVQNIIDKLTEDPSWRGLREVGSGAPRKTTAKEDEKIVKTLIDNRGKAKVTCHWLRTQLPFLKKIKKTALEERLYDAGLVYMRRRNKTLVATVYLEERVSFCRGVKRKHQDTLNLWCWSDGTVFYLDRTLVENESTQRAALGSFVWRKADCTDSLYADCVGPSNYKKAQGIPVRVWGLLVGGKLNVYILEEGEVMDQTLYIELIEDKFSEWMAHCRYLVQDFEPCLRAEGSLEALDRIGLELVEDYPRSSQDFNAIENIWKLLRERLHVTLPQGLEPRDAFVTRLLAAVAWLNRNRVDQMWMYATNQKERATDCLKSEPPGARTKW